MQAGPPSSATVCERANGRSPLSSTPLTPRRQVSRSDLRMMALARLAGSGRGGIPPTVNAPPSPFSDLPTCAGKVRLPHTPTAFGPSGPRREGLFSSSLPEKIRGGGFEAYYPLTRREVRLRRSAVVSSRRVVVGTEAQTRLRAPGRSAVSSRGVRDQTLSLPSPRAFVPDGFLKVTSGNARTLAAGLWRPREPCGEKPSLNAGCAVRTRCGRGGGLGLHRIPRTCGVSGWHSTRVRFPPPARFAPFRGFPEGGPLGPLRG
jgi:hypothetical protein